MKNPLDQFRSSLFGTRGCDIALALQYVDELASASSDAVAVQTAARVLLNTCANAVAQVVDAPSPEKLALIELIDHRISESKLVRTEDLESKVQDWIECNLDFDDMISEWMGNNFDITDHDDNIDWDTQLGNRISEWMSDNLEDKINDLELVVKVK
jgi:DNA-binding GntR family transcriptional regulator